MSLRQSLRELLRADRTAFEDRLPTVADAHGFDHRPLGGDTAGPELDAAVGTGSDHERELARRAWLVDDAPLGVTVSGPAYQDNPIVYANRRFRDICGYSLDELRGENPRLLQGPETESDAVADLREAVTIWEPVTVELWNYRADGSRFRNRVSLVPTEDETGTVTNWVGIQQRID
ncbi:PAS domain-containing protein [Halapricum sp. CBA1109]|uniref:PAS domain-containing protein n=1 Tax=Halapricum sp. CBA1109 TaxID=2668068 RepID=UPI0012FAF9FF|nr:PAS domain-containing protein [Halapricum sp. CBA1109]MUV89320.1 PAS domain-containing protein [Halapricum sp. CBA1109]